MRILKQAWWAPLAAVLVLAQVGVALAFIFGRGTSNLLDAESTGAGVTLSLTGAIALAVGLASRPRRPGIAHLLILFGAALAALWFWLVVVTPLAIAVMAGVVSNQVQSAHQEPRHGHA